MEVLTENRVEHHAKGQDPRNFGNDAKSYNTPSKIQGSSGRSQASDWNARRPEVLFNNHQEYLLKHEYKRGMIINAPVHEATSQRGKSRANSHYESISAFGGVFTKPRFLIVVALHTTEYTSIPIYTHNREGLRGKEHYRNEFVSIRDPRLGGAFKSQSDHPPLVTQGNGPIIDAVATAWLTHTVTRSYDLNLSRCGDLKPESLDRLVEYMETEMRKGLGLPRLSQTSR